VRFLHSSVFLHAYLKPRRKLKPREQEVKERAKEVVRRVDEQAEEVVTTVVHVVKVTNILEARLGLEKSVRLVWRILTPQTSTR